jgi:hypothetical protein
MRESLYVAVTDDDQKGIRLCKEDCMYAAVTVETGI